MDLTSIIYQLSGVFTFLIIFLVFIFAYMFILRYKNQKKFDHDKNGNKIWVHFWSPGGQYFNLICNEDMGRVQPPEGHEIGDYFIENSSVYSGWYPQGEGLLNKLTRVSVPTTTYIMNRREPVVSTDPKRWIESKDKSEITATMQRVAVNESFAKSAQALQSAAWKDIANMMNYVKNVPYQFYIMIGVLVVNLIIAYMVYTLTANVSNVMAAFFGSK